MHGSPTPRRNAGLALAALALATLGLAGCGGEDGPGGSELAGGEYGADVQELTDGGGDGFFAGPYGTSFADDLPSYVGEEVVLTGDVEKVLGPSAFTIVGPEQADVEPLLVLVATGGDELAAGTGVEVTGTVQKEFTAADAEAELGVDLDDALLADHAGDTFLVAQAVELLPTPAG